MSDANRSTDRRPLGPMAVKGPAGVMETLLGFSDPDETAGPPLELTGAHGDDRWIRESRVGSGGMGHVEQVFDLVLDRRSAMKVQHAAHARQPNAARLFLKEVRITGRLEHPNIVPVHEYGVTERGESFFTMQLVQGRSFQEVLQAEGVPRRPDDIYDRFDVFLKVCDALSFAHSRGVVHCDIKPANVMVGDFGEVFLMDWGIAQVVDPALLLGPDPPRGDDGRRVARRYPPHAEDTVLGTPAYLSPEQACGEPVTFQSDVYAMGVMLYQMFTGKQPYVGRTATGTLERVLEGDLLLPSLLAIDAWVPREIERIIVCALQREPEDRYASIADLRSDVVRFMRGGGEFPTRSYAAGEVIIRRGEVGEAAYIINTGSCVVDINDGANAIELGAGDVFGEAAVLSSGVRNATVTAIEPTECYVVTGDVFNRQLDALPEWMRLFITTLARRFGQNG